MKRKVDLIVVHCSATKPDQDVDANEINKWHVARGWSEIGYHFVIKLDGTLERGRDIEKVGAHVAGHNANSIGICVVGGLDARGKPSATFNRDQQGMLAALLGELRVLLPKARILGHRDLSPDANGDGKVAPNEWFKACPSFDVREWCARNGIDPEPL